MEALEVGTHVLEDIVGESVFGGRRPVAVFINIEAAEKGFEAFQLDNSLSFKTNTSVRDIVFQEAEDGV